MVLEQLDIHMQKKKKKTSTYVVQCYTKLTNEQRSKEKSTGFSESLWPIVRKEFLDTLIKQKRKKLINWNLFF